VNDGKTDYRLRSVGGHSDMANHLDVEVIWYQCFVKNPADLPDLFSPDR
jgi:hypothetical protein